ncbi:MAG: hypothetical protein IPP94_08780 [Ignavibacteria bacterium]|nr:hypothetical protein [Ignavibacteria bacterium]
MLSKEFIRHSRTVLLILDGLLFVCCLAGLNQLARKPGLGHALVEDASAQGDGSIRVAERIAADADTVLAAGDRILRARGIAVSVPEKLEAILDRSAIGSTVPLVRARSGLVETVSVRLVRSNSVRYLLLVLLTGSVYFFVGIFVIIKRPSSSAARLFHPVSLMVAVLVMTTWGGEAESPPLLAHLLRALFHLSYAVTGVLLVHFTLHFPVSRPGRLSRLLPAAYGVSMLLFLITAAASIVFFETGTREALDVYHAAYQVSRLYFMLGLGVSVVNILYSTRRSVAEIDRRSIRPALAGLLVTALGFGGLWMLPVFLSMRPVITEEQMLLISVVAPVAFAVSIVKYRLLEIDFFIKRGLVYFLVLLLMFGVYAVIDWLLFLTFVPLKYPILLAVSGVTFVVTYLVIEPAGGFIQRVIDRRFFRVNYDFRNAQRTIVNRIRQSYDVQRLARTVVDEVDRLIPVTRIALFVLRQKGDRLVLVAHKGFDMLEGRGIAFDRVNLRNALDAPAGLPEHIEPGLPIEDADRRMFTRWELALAFPMLTENHAIIGFLALGPKRSNSRFSLEDVDLLNTVTTQTGLSIERMHLQEKLLLEQLESKRLQELNQLKSYFVSSVSHELKTPLTSIRMFSELLRETPDLADSTREKYLRIIEGESDRLSRLITNVLDYARIEHGVKTYHFDTVDLDALTTRTLDILEYQISMKHFTVARRGEGIALPVRADPDAVEQAVMNLLGNAIKYAGESREITVTTGTENDEAVVSVQDHGIGISRQERDRLFDAFFRAGGDETRRVAGAGLGLTIVRHIMDAHEGRITVDSVPGHGSTFTLRFPRLGTALPH